MSAKYKIPVIVYSHTWKELIEIDIPKRLPKFFKRHRPMAFVKDDISLKGNRFNAILIDERIIETRSCDIANDISYGKFIGYRNINHL